jgi:leucine dehydrogenase
MIMPLKEVLNMPKTLEDTLVLEEIIAPGYEKIIKVTDERSGLKGIICIHNTTLGPALGGTRIYPYPTFEAALTDVKRLAKGMTYKAALSDSATGGGKSVIIADPKRKSKEMLVSFAEAINRLEGLYTGAEDVGCSLEDVTLISQITPYVVGVHNDKSSGNPAPFTAWGTFRGIQSVCKKLFGTDAIEGKTVAIQGLGSVGSILAELLFWHGAKLVVSDIDWEKTLRFAKKFDAKACPIEDILQVECDILAPCALGGIINPQTIPSLKCRAIAGCANNQLLSDQDADDLLRRGILYAPDFVINAGGLINVIQELEPQGYNPAVARQKVNQLYDQLLQIYTIAEQNQISTNQAAISLADYRLKYGVGKRTVSPVYHHFKK